MFWNYWLEHPRCLEIVRNAWDFSPHSNPMHAFSHLLSRTIYNILNWRKDGLNSLDFDLKTLESHINSLEGELSRVSGGSADEGIDNLNSLRNLYNSYNSLF